jgi:hypothetical protein
MDRKMIDSWEDAAAQELAELAAAHKADPKTFVHADGVRTRGKIDGKGAMRALELSERLTALARQAGSLVVT